MDATWFFDVFWWHGGVFGGQKQVQKVWCLWNSSFQQHDQIVPDQMFTEETGHPYARLDPLLKDGFDQAPPEGDPCMSRGEIGLHDMATRWLRL